MSSILYPVAETAEAALHAPRGYAAREREAQVLAASGVRFVSEAVGPAFATCEAANDAYAGRLGDERVGGSGAEGGERWSRLVPVSAPRGDRRAPGAQLKPAYMEGRRWPRPEGETAILWRLSVSYWRTSAATEELQIEAARKLRRGEAGRGLGAPALNALARQPLRPVRLQQPLDIGLFEVRPPEAPDTLIPDE